MGRLGRSLLLVVLAGCRAEKFVSPDKPDLYKVPYDFAVRGADLTGHDLSATELDLAAAPHDDLAHEEHD